MKKKTIALMGFSVLAALALVGCKEEKNDKPVATSGEGGQSESTTSSEKQDTKGLDISVSYQGKQGISLIKDSYVNPVEQRTYSGGKTAYATRDLLPTWAEFASKLKTTIRDAENYSGNSDNNVYSAMVANQYKSFADSSEMVDLFYNSTGNADKAITASAAKDLNQFINRGLMPNFKNYLEANPTIADQLTKSDGKIYYTPYFDGYQFLERQFVLNSGMVYEVLDQNSFDSFDTATAGTGAAANQLQANKYEPFVYEMNGDTKVNYAGEAKTIEVSKNGEKVSITVKGNVENIISQQNALLTAGTTGKALAEQMRTYLDAVYGENIGADKTFKKYTDIFCSESAAYTTDELVALMRVIKANPGVISGVFDENLQLTQAGDTNTEVEIIIPRGAANNRVQNIMMFLQLFGIQGTDAEDAISNSMYFDADGTLSSYRSTKASYQGLEYLHQFFEEGLIIDQFWKYDKASFSDGSYYRDKYFGHTKDGGGYGFMMYDYSATQGQANQIDNNGIGVQANNVLEGYKDNPTGRTIGSGDSAYSVGVMPVLPPLTYWANKGSAEENLSKDITDRSNKTLMRYSDSNRSLKTNTWYIPATADNADKAAQLMDYVFSEEGADIQDFGPSIYWGADITYKGVVDRGLSAATLSMLAAGAAGDCFSFWRGYVGSSHGIGHVRSDHLNYIFMHEITRIGDNNLANALKAGVLKLATVDDESVWGSCVPSVGFTKTAATDASFDAVTAFWSQDKAASSANGWAYIVANGVPTDAATALGNGTINTNTPYTYNDVMAQYQTTYITAFLATALSTTKPNLEQFLPEYVLG